MVEGIAECDLYQAYDIHNRAIPVDLVGHHPTLDDLVPSISTPTKMLPAAHRPATELQNLSPSQRQVVVKTQE